MSYGGVFGSMVSLLGDFLGLCLFFLKCLNYLSSRDGLVAIVEQQLPCPPSTLPGKKALPPPNNK